PSFGINLNLGNGSHNTTSSGGGGGFAAAGGNGRIQTSNSHFILGEPEFGGTDQVIQYCNHVRAVMVQAAIELAVASKILEARLAQASADPGANVFQRRMAARSVASKLRKA
ncbi:plasmid transfer protein TraA, partial [Kitasatospora sp. SC0581]|uniref:plasmid transfer protein TraA n=1 Tax=Kitasatospora sp. SC0581 TaxID=3394360 RepID=UPI003A892478